jgi:hypothetical protein
MEDHGMSRRTQDAATRFVRAANLLRHQAESAPNDDARWLAGAEAGDLLWRVLFEADILVPILNHDETDNGEDLERFAKRLHAALRNHRLAASMDNVTGRTAEEAETFRNRAQQLRNGTV